MLKSITAIAGEDLSLNLELSNPYKNGIAITNIDGLGPVESSLHFTAMASGRGSVFNSSTIQTRKITISLRIIGTDVENIRREIYRYFRIGSSVQLLVETDARNYITQGYVSSCNPIIFSEKETVSVVIECPIPYFYGVNLDGLSNVLDISEITKKFEFAFSNESLTEKLIEFSRILESTEFTIFYEGTVPSGITFHIHANTNLTSFAIRSDTNMGNVSIDMTRLKKIYPEGIKAGDEIDISSVSGNKYVRLTRAGQTKNIINCIGENISWIELQPGDNRFRYRLSDGESMTISMDYHNQYEGI